MIVRTLLASLLLCACASDGASEQPKPAPAQTAAEGGGGGGEYVPLQEPLASGGPYPTLLLTEAWFTTVAGKPKPMPARLEIYQKTGSGWKRARLEDGESNVFHKAMPYKGGILTASGEKAMIKHWTFSGGKWSSKVLWEDNWGGRFNRMRDVEIGDVDGDGKDEIVVATHDAGVVAVLEPELLDGKGAGVTQLDRQADTFVHEIEIGDVDGDGKNEFFATPSDRNKANTSQAGKVVMYKWDGQTYVRSEVDPREDTHAKEIMAADLDGDGTAEFFSVFEAELGSLKEIVTPVQINQYTYKKDGTFDQTVIGTIDDRQTRFLVHGDFDGDGREELVAAAMKKGLFYFDTEDGKTWTRSTIASDSAGFEHSVFVSDLDGDKQPELYVAADDQKEVRVYTYDKGAKTWKKEVIGKLDPQTITWNITTAKM